MDKKYVEEDILLDLLAQAILDTPNDDLLAMAAERGVDIDAVFRKVKGMIDKNLREAGYG